MYAAWGIGVEGLRAAWLELSYYSLRATSLSLNLLFLGGDGMGCEETRRN